MCPSKNGINVFNKENAQTGNFFNYTTVKLSRNVVDPSSAHVSAGGGHSLGANLWIVIIMAWLLIVIMGTYTCIYTADT